MLTKLRFAILFTIVTVGSGAAHAALYGMAQRDGTLLISSDPDVPGATLLVPDDVELAFQQIDAAPSIKTLRPLSEESLKQLARLEPAFKSISARLGVDIDLLKAIAFVESRFRADSLSSKGAIGVMQVMPATGARYGARNLKDRGENIEVGARYFRDLLARFNGNVALALAGYNAGEGAVERRGRQIPAFRETMLYVPQVLLTYEQLRRAPAPRRQD